MSERTGLTKYLPQIDLGSKIALGSLSAYVVYKLIVSKIVRTFKSSNRKHLRYAAKKMQKAHMHVLGSVAIFGVSAMTARALRVDVSLKWCIPLAVVGIVAKSVSYPSRKTKYALWVTFNAGAGVLIATIATQAQTQTQTSAQTQTTAITQHAPPATPWLIDHVVLFSATLATSALFAAFVRAVSPRRQSHTARAMTITTSLAGPLLLVVPAQMVAVHYSSSFLPASWYPVSLSHRLPLWRMALSMCAAGAAFGAHSFVLATFRLQHARLFLHTPSPSAQARARYEKLRNEQRDRERDREADSERDRDTQNAQRESPTRGRSPSGADTERSRDRERRDSDRDRDRERDTERDRDTHRPRTPEEQEEEDREFAELSESDDDEERENGAGDGAQQQGQKGLARENKQKGLARERERECEYQPRKFGECTREMKALLELMVCPAHEARIDSILARLQAKHNAGHARTHSYTRFSAPASPSKRLSFGATLSMSEREQIVAMVRNENLRYLRDAEERIPDLEGTLAGDPIDQSLLMLADGPFMFLPSIITGALFSYYDRLRKRYEQQRQAGLVRRRHAEQNRRLAALYALPFTAVGAAAGMSAGPQAGLGQVVGGRGQEGKRDARAGGAGAASAARGQGQTHAHAQSQSRDSPRTPAPNMQLLFEYDLDDVFQMRQSMRAQ